MPVHQSISISDILTRGGDILKLLPDFQLVGRAEELKELTTILMKMRKNNLIVTGRGGVGISSIVLGIQASKRDLRTPVDIVGKRFYWLNTDKLFESGNSQVINSLFDKVRQTLSKTKDTVLVVEDTVDFIKASQNNGCTNLINGLMGDIKSGKYQAILESKDDNLGEVLKCDGDMQECCTLYEVKEPSSENLHLILNQAVRSLEKHHGIKISPSAIKTAALLTEKYKLPELRAQPDAAVSLIDQALTDYRREAHASNGSVDWDKRQNEIRALYNDMSDGGEEIRKLEDEIDRLREEQSQKAQHIEEVSKMISSANLDTDEVTALKARIAKLETHIKHATDTYKHKVAEIYAGLELDESSVLRSFSALSGIPVDKLNEDERNRLKNLEQLLSRRVIGQEEPTLEVAKAVKRSRLGLKMPNKPSGTFMFLGPSGVGKTELAKALAEALQVPLLRFDMSEYMEKHAVSKLIGAPPGYEGYEHGGILTNAARRNPYSVVLFDEIEKAHVDVFNVMLQLLDDARLTDSRGLTASFKDTIVIMTTNIGTPHFLDESIEFSESKELALNDLRTQYRPEFLGRFGGNIYCFQRLSDPVLLSIARKDLLRINDLIADRGISIEMADTDLSAMVASKYVAREGARSILGYIDRNITSGIADVVLTDTPVQGKIMLSFDSTSASVSFTPVGKS